MDPTGLPTDSVYKFIALSGLAIAGFAIWFWWTRTQQFLKTSAALQIDHATLATRKTYLLQRHERLRRHEGLFALKRDHLHEIYSMLHTVPRDHQTDQIKHDIAQNRAELETAEAEARELDLRSDAMLAELEDVAKKLDAMDVTARAQSSEGQLVTFLQKGAVVAVCWGLLQSLGGFLAWYFMTQRFQDESMAFALREQKAKATLADESMVFALREQKAKATLADESMVFALREQKAKAALAEAELESKRRPCPAPAELPQKAASLPTSPQGLARAPAVARTPAPPQAHSAQERASGSRRKQTAERTGE